MRNLLILAVVVAFGLPAGAGDCAGLVHALPQSAASYNYSQSTVIERVQTPVYDVVPAPVPCSCQTITRDLPAASYYPSYSTGSASYVSRSYDIPRYYDIPARTVPVRYLGPPVHETVYHRPPVRDIAHVYYPPREIVRERVPVYHAPREIVREVPVQHQPAGVFANLRARTAAGAGAGGLFGAVEGLTGVGDGSGQFLQGAVIARFLPGGGGFRFKR